jgi:hypothetical protein
MKNKRQNFQIYSSSKCAAGQTVTPKKELAASGRSAVNDIKI